MAITSKTAQTADTANWVHGCFIVRVGTDFNTFLDVANYAEQDELSGSNSTTALDPAVQQVLSAATSGTTTGTTSTTTSGDNGSALPLYFSKRKCRDTSLGGNDAINPLPQFCEDDDITHPHFYTDLNAKVGMGQVYSENFDDTQQILYLGFGIPLFNNVGSFWAKAIDVDMTGFVNKNSGITAEKIGYLLGSAPIRLINIATIPYRFIKAMANGIEQVPISKYYAFSSQMPMYFRFVNTILVNLATNLNIMGSSSDYSTTGSVTTSTTSVGLVTDGANTGDGGDLSGLPPIFKDYGLDMAKIMTKRYFYETGDSQYKDRNTDDALFNNSQLNGGQGVGYDSGNDQSADDAAAATTSTNPTANATNTATASSTDGSVAANDRMWTMSWFDGFAAAYKQTIYDGHLFIGFRIDEGMGASESFSNNTGESQISQAVNAKFQDAGNTYFGTGNGNLGSSGIAGALGGLLQGAAGFVKGALSAFNLDPLAAAASGAVRISIPEVWMNSSYSRSQSFSISCLSPYGDVESIFQSEYVPLACMLAGALPRGTGEASHSAPFVCQAYCRGIFSSPLAIIESLQVTRGADQFGFTANRLPLKLTMNVTLKDLSPVMYMTMGGNKGIANALMGQEDAFSEYMMTLSGMGLRDRLAPFAAMRRKVKILLGTAYENRLSPFMLGMEGGDRFLISRVISTVVGGGRGLPGN